MNKKGFTVIEMLIALTIVSIICVMVVIGVSNFNKNDQFDLALNDFQSHLKEIQNWSLTGQIVDDLIEVPDYGYGISYGYPGENSYLVFADVYNEIAGDDYDYKYDISNDIVLAEYTLAGDAQFEDCIYVGAPIVQVGQVYDCSIVFEMQDIVARVRTDEEDPSEDGVFEFILKNFKTEEEKSIIIKKWLGSIYQQ